MRIFRSYAKYRSWLNSTLDKQPLHIDTEHSKFLSIGFLYPPGLTFWLHGYTLTSPESLRLLEGPGADWPGL